MKLFQIYEHERHFNVAVRKKTWILWLCKLFLKNSCKTEECNFYKMTNKMQLCRIIYCFLTALHVSSDIFAHHQAHLNCNYSFWFYSRVVVGCCHDSSRQRHTWRTRSCNYSEDAPDDERKYSSKHVEQSRNNKLSYTVASCWSFCKNCNMMHGTMNIKLKNAIAAKLINLWRGCAPWNRLNLEV